MKTYELADSVRYNGMTQGSYSEFRGTLDDGTQIRAVATGVKRMPKAGEWYLSGALIEAYRARGDLTATYPLARLVLVTDVPSECVETI